MRPARLAFLAVVLIGACLADPVGVEPAPPPAGLVVSDPAPAGAADPTREGPALGATGESDSVVYVSLAPETAPVGITATIRAVVSGATVTTPVEDGGFDPVSVAAQTSDTIEVVVRDESGTVVLQTRTAVARVRPPIVVRTDPPPKKRDVPLNSVMIVVFSEPIDVGTLAESVQLLRSGDPVLGTIAFQDAKHLIARFVPAASLAGGTTYELVVRQGVRDLDGESLEAPVTAEFVTEEALGRIAFTTMGDTIPSGIYVMNADGSAVTRLTIPQGNELHWQPAWSPDGRRIAFVNSGTPTEGIWVVNADGSGAQATAAPAVLGGLVGSPTWSPDGTMIAFHTWRVRYQYNPDAEFNVTDIHSIKANGTDLVQLLSEEDPGRWGGYPTWALDGRFAFMSSHDNLDAIKVMNGDASSQTTALQWGGCCITELAWSPDHSKIAFTVAYGTADGNYDYDIYVINADGSGLGRITADSTTREEHPTWSPDGRQIAFSKTIGAFYLCGDGSPCYMMSSMEIYVMNADGSRERQLTSGRGFKSQPAWSPR